MTDYKASTETNAKPTPNLSQIRSSAEENSVVELVQRAIGHSYPDDARAAVRAVANWLSQAQLGVDDANRALVVGVLYDQANGITRGSCDKTSTSVGQ